jgi:hypothetical protein
LRIAPARDIAGGKDSRCAGLEPFVDGPAAVDLEAGTFGDLDARTHADTDDDEISRQSCAAFELGASLRLRLACVRRSGRRDVP